MLVRSVIYRKNGWGFNFIRPFHIKTPLKSEPSSSDSMVFYYKTQYLCGFSRSHFLFASWTKNRKTQIRQLEDLKTNLFEPISLSTRVL